MIAKTGVLVVNRNDTDDKKFGRVTFMLNNNSKHFMVDTTNYRSHCLYW